MRFIYLCWNYSLETNIFFCLWLCFLHCFMEGMIRCMIEWCKVHWFTMFVFTWSSCIGLVVLRVLVVWRESFEYLCGLLRFLYSKMWSPSYWFDIYVDVNQCKLVSSYVYCYLKSSAQTLYFYFLKRINK